MPRERNVEVQTDRALSSARVIRVLIADDERDTVLTLAALLRDEGYDTKGAYSGQDALVAIGAYDPHVIIADIAMPQRNGWDIAREVRSIRSGKRRDRPLLIGISGIYNKGADRVLANMAGFNHFLSKPFDPNALLRLLPPLRPRSR
jgi:CheY-like chemotaxis protein